MKKKLKKIKESLSGVKVTKVGITLFAATFFTFLGVVALSVILYLAYHDKTIFDSTKFLSLEKGSKIGDLVGGFAGVFFTVAGILLLYRTLQLQRTEFEKTHQIISDQQFENTFFNMLNVLMNIVSHAKGNVHFNNTLFGDLDSPDEGYSLFAKSNSALNDYINMEMGLNNHVTLLDNITNLGEVTTLERENLISTLDSGYKKFYEKNGFLIGHYNRYFFSIIKFIFENKEGDDIKKYLDIVQAQLSDQEMGLLFYYAISSVGIDSKKEKVLFKWLDEYSFFRNISKESLQDQRHHIVYSKTIFKFQSIDSVNWKLGLV